MGLLSFLSFQTQMEPGSKNSVYCTAKTALQGPGFPVALTYMQCHQQSQASLAN